MNCVGRLIYCFCFAFSTCVPCQSVDAGDGLNYGIAYATYLGGSQWDQAREAIPGPDGSVLVGAQTSSADMPTSAGAVQPKYAGDDPNLGHGGVYGGDCYLARLSPDGRQIVAATYFGGSKQERNVYGMELDRAGNVVITSMTRSRDLPTSEGCFQQEHGGSRGGIFAAKLSSDLKQLVWCTYVGGSGDEAPRGGLALDANDHVCIFGTTASGDFPTTPGAFQGRRNGSRDAFVAKLKADGSGLVWSTLFGGSADDYMLGGRIDENGNVYFAGHTTSADLPRTTDGAQSSHGGGKSDGWLAVFNSDASRLLYCTYFGGSGDDMVRSVALGPKGELYLVGHTASRDFPASEGSAQTEYGGGSGDAFVMKLVPSGI